MDKMSNKQLGQIRKISKKKKRNFKEDRGDSLVYNIICHYVDLIVVFTYFSYYLIVGQ